jgi:hypothetical protein
VYRKRDPSLHLKHGQMGGLRDETPLLERKIVAY